MEKLKVSSKSKSNSVAGAITNIIKSSGEMEIQVVGAGALNQLVKAIIISRGYLVPLGIDIVCIPSFSSVQFDNDLKTAIKMLIKSV